MAPDEAAFLKAIGDNLADETARLAYADWLADRDDPRAAFARLSAEFLRCVRGLADMRQMFPLEWAKTLDPLFDRLNIVRVPRPGDTTESGIVRSHVAPGSSVVRDQPLFEFETDKATMDITAEHAGTVISVLVRRGDRVSVGQPILAYLALPIAATPATASAPVSLPAEPQVPSGPLRDFIRSLESRRESLRSAPAELIEALIARHRTAATMVFGDAAVRQALRAAEMNLGFGFFQTVVRREMLVSLLQRRGVTAEQMPQIRLDIHLETLRVLLQTYGQPDRIRELPDDTAPATE